MFFTLIFPLMFLVIFTVIFGNGHVQVAPGQTVRVATFYVPAIAAFSVINACYMNIAISLSFSRVTGGLKRVHVSLVPVGSYMAGRVVRVALGANLGGAT